LKVNPDDYIQLNSFENLVKTTYAFECKFYEPLAKNNWLTYFVQACKDHQSWTLQLAKENPAMKWLEFKEAFYIQMMGETWKARIKNMIIRKNPQNPKTVYDFVKEINDLSNAIGLDLEDEHIVVHIKDHLPPQYQAIVLDIKNRQQIEHTLQLLTTVTPKHSNTTSIPVRTCSHCKKSHDEKDCWFKHPDKAPRAWKK
jgi:hypothetical protein